jgi:ubiquinone/menaquinone biosynthesis C-methylase UbiE/uncharacterized protein YbaR (Trm112 family)
MPGDRPLDALIACPRCDKSPLTVRSERYRCDACRIDFPSIGGIPWLFAEPEASLGEWRNRLHFALQQLATDSQRLKKELQDEELLSATRARLQHLRRAVDQHRENLRDLLAPLDVHASTASYESYLALRTRLPTNQGIATYYNNIHRDWSWGDAENAASLDVIREVAGEGDLGSVLVLGAGAGRLAYDIHMQLAARNTVAVDFNPLLILVAAKMFGGATLELHEFPIAPRTAEDVAVARKLAAPRPARDGFELVLADALRPPFAAASFDTVVTPWLIDIVNDDLPRQAARINGLLKDGGRWLNFGSLAFSHPRKKRCYSDVETAELVAAAGFSLAGTIDREIPYMCSPASRHARRELVMAFAATKTSSVATPERHKALPDWIVTGKGPVPLTQSFRSQAMSTRIHAFIMSMIDGQRTLHDMAELLEQQQLMTKEEALPALRNFFTRMYDDSERASGY